MSTVALRGTLHREDATGEWHWRGMWAFGNSVSTAAPRSQQPFEYTFLSPVNPEEVRIPGIMVEMEENEDLLADESAGERANEGGLLDAPAKETKRMEETTNDPGKTNDRPIDSGRENPHEESIAAGQPSSPKRQPEETSSPNVPGLLEPPVETKTAITDSTKELESDSQGRQPTFATVPEGHPPFTDACIQHPDKLCPPSGRWKGHFQNFVSARPREKIEQIQEIFYLFFNGTPGPDVVYAFDDKPLPPGVQKECLVLVRGTGTNPFGTFELIGYLDLTSGVIEIQRQYVLIPAKKRNRRSVSTPNSTKSYSTRKRQPSWKRKSLEGEDDPTPKRQRRREKNASTSTPTGTPMIPIGGDALGSVAPSAIPGDAPMPGEAQALHAISPATTTSKPASSSGQAGYAVTIVPPPPTRETLPPSGTGTKPSKTPRNRSSSVGSTKPASSISVSPCSPHLKLPPVGEPKKARWRAAHFLYYQRNDPEDDEIKTPKYVVYEGEMVNSMREGRGICLFSNGLLYEGEWKRNKEHGVGQLWTADRKRLIYDGNWERGRMQGQGTYYYGNDGKSSETTGPQGGARYTGEFKENMRHGLGEYRLPDGSVYHGMWSQGKMNGRGVLTWPDLSVYDGDFKDGERHGQGLLRTSDGFSYDGTWVQNAMEGRGIARYPNGQSFEGLFSNGRREGRGTMHFTNGAVYEGRFRDDAVDGQGTMKISRSLVIPNADDGEDNSNSGEISKNSATKRPDFMIPISFQSDITHVHAKAGFTAIGD